MDVESWMEDEEARSLSPAQARRQLQEQLAAEAEQKRTDHEAAGAPTKDALVADLLRVASCEENPWRRTQSVGARLYHVLGWYSTRAWQLEFGTFAEFKRAAGLLPKRGTRRLQAAIADRVYREQGQHYAAKYLLPYMRHGPARRTCASMDITVATISDTHATYLDPFVWSVFLDVVSDLEPHYVVLNGDVLDLAAVSRYIKYPFETVPLQVEFDFVRRMLEQLREVAPDAGIVWTAGNHGIERWSKFLATSSRELAGLRCTEFDKLIPLGDLDIQLAQGGQFCSPAGTQLDEPAFEIDGVWLAYHGRRTGKFAWAQELADMGISGTSGHIHRAGVAYETVRGRRQLSWMSTPAACVEEVGRHYAPPPKRPMQQGFGLTHIWRDHVRQYPVICTDGMAEVHGRLYEAHWFKRQDPMMVWL